LCFFRPVLAFAAMGMESPDTRRRRLIALRLMTPTGRPRVGRSLFPSSGVQAEDAMTGIPTSLAIAIWIAGSCWAVALVAYFLNAEMNFLARLMIVGATTGAAEWWWRERG